MSVVYVFFVKLRLRLRIELDVESTEYARIFECTTWNSFLETHRKCRLRSDIRSTPIPTAVACSGVPLH